MLKASSKSRSSNVNKASQDIQIRDEDPPLDPDDKEPTYTSNEEEEESYEPDFQSENDGPFSNDEQQY
jgi:hypothetical protein